MNKADENNIRIADYLEGKMSAAEEEAFMQELGDDERLRDRYEEELLISGLLGQDSNDADLTVISKQDKAYETETVVATGKKKANKIFILLKQYRSIAAIVLIVIAAAFVYFFLKPDYKQLSRVATVSKDTATGSTNKEVATMPGEKNFLDSVYKNFYTAYVAGNEDPVEISEYYMAYKKKQYAKVLSATKADYQVMGTEDNNSKAEQYMDLYKGFAYLDNNKPDSAIKKFEAAMSGRAAGIDKLYYTAQWYSALAWLKENNITEALTIANNIQQSASPYKLKAEALLQQFDNR